jgi:NADH:ubiquinone oxidoreductase subunit 2 (subunit N)
MYVVSYGLPTLALTALLVLNSRMTIPHLSISSLRGISPMSRTIRGFRLLTLIGLPPLALFITKAYVF